MRFDYLAHFYPNKYIVPWITGDEYLLSYCFDQKALWFRVPKVATRSIHDVLRANLDGYYHASFNAYLPNRYDEWFKFSFVRDPVYRIESAWRNKVVKANRFGFTKGNWRKMQSFSNFVEWLGSQDLKTCDPHLRLQTELLDVDNMDFIGRFSHLSDDFGVVAQNLGLDAPQLGRHNRSTERRAEMDEGIKSVLMELYREDYETFDEF